MTVHDVTVVGAGAAGLFCAGIAAQRGLRVIVLDHASRLAEKVRISGGGRCNFTNLETQPARFLSENPSFCRSALARYTPEDFVALVRRHRIGFHEKHRGQLFCDDSSERIVAMLLDEAAACDIRPGITVGSVAAADGGFRLETSTGPLATRRLVIATGGLSIPKIGASDFGYRIARQFGHRIVETRPGLVPFVFDPGAWSHWTSLSGVSLPVRIGTGTGRQRATFDEDLLFTHRGLSGPAALQVSSGWRPGSPVEIDLSPAGDLAATLVAAKSASARHLSTELGRLLPARLAEAWLQARGESGQRPMPELSDRALRALAASLRHWSLVPAGTEGYRKAEVTVGGVDTRELDGRSMESRRVAGLYFIGEVTDVTGWLGGYNFQWAWASAAACARSMGSGVG